MRESQGLGHLFIHFSTEGCETVPGPVLLGVRRLVFPILPTDGHDFPLLHPGPGGHSPAVHMSGRQRPTSPRSTEESYEVYWTDRFVSLSDLRPQSNRQSDIR